MNISILTIKRDCIQHWNYLTPDEAYYKDVNNKYFDAKSVLLGIV